MTVTVALPGLRERTYGTRWHKAHRANMRKARLAEQWKRAGGAACRGYPEVEAIQHYYLLAPYDLSTRDWSRFRKWMKERIVAAQAAPLSQPEAGPPTNTECN